MAYAQRHRLNKVIFGSAKTGENVEELLDQPELLNKAPYDAWIIKVENVTDTEELLDAAAYEAFCTEEG